MLSQHVIEDENGVSAVDIASVTTSLKTSVLWTLEALLQTPHPRLFRIGSMLTDIVTAMLRSHEAECLVEVRRLSLTCLRQLILAIPTAVCKVIASRIHFDFLCVTIACL